MLDSLEDDIMKGTLLLLEEKARIMNISGNKYKTFTRETYCLYLGYSRDINQHLLLCEGEIFRLNGFNLITKTYIIQN